MEQYKLNAIFEEFDDVIHNKGDFVEVVEWKNGDGVDINMHVNKQQKHISISYDELEKIQKLVLQLKGY